VIESTFRMKGKKYEPVAGPTRYGAAQRVDGKIANASK